MATPVAPTAPQSVQATQDTYNWHEPDYDPGFEPDREWWKS